MFFLVFRAVFFIHDINCYKITSKRFKKNKTVYVNNLICKIKNIKVILNQYILIKIYTIQVFFSFYKLFKIKSVFLYVVD